MKYWVFCRNDGPWLALPMNRLRLEDEIWGKKNGYYAVIGPFRTKRAAMLTVMCRNHNPHLQSVHDAEVISKLISEKEKAK